MVNYRATDVQQVLQLVGVRDNADKPLMILQKMQLANDLSDTHCVSGMHSGSICR